MGNIASGSTKPFVIATDGDGAEQERGFVEVNSSHLLGQTRELILKEFDRDMLPCEGDDFYFRCNGVRLSAYQEGRLHCWDLLDQKYEISIHPKRIKRKDPSPSKAFDTPILSKKPCTRKDAEEKHTSEASEEQRVNTSTIKANKESSSTQNTLKQSDAIDNELRSQEEFMPNNGGGKESIFPIESPGIRASASSVKDGADKEDNMDATSINFATPTHSSLSLTDKGTTNNINPQLITEEKYEAHDHISRSHSGQNLFKTHHIDFGLADGVQNIQESDTEIKNNDSTAGPCIGSKDGNQDNTGSILEEATYPFTFTAAESDSDDDISDMALEPEDNAHKDNEIALKQSCTVFNEIDSILKQNPLICSEKRRQEWMKEIADCLAKSAPRTVVGVLGNTGVGKSSLLNALLDEASVLPTSGSRGCTAAVVELRFNSDLFDRSKGETAVYKGEVEFITLDEWAHELKILVDECSSHDEKSIDDVAPEVQVQPDAAAAWSKIDQVYGRGTMASYRGQPKSVVYEQLLTNHHVHDFLACKEGSINLYNSILVEEGQIDPKDSKSLLQGFEKIQGKLRRSRKKWAYDFRARINDYVYRKGNCDQPQTWPLIRKVVLHGPWPVLSTGACLVDLPGVRDANVARAKVSEHYLQNCSQIWVVAPIKRAVDDGTAKELLGEQFKHRLLMDGQYGNVSFICTQTDDCEATETMRDHQDVAVQKPGRWEKMTDLSDRLAKIDKELADLRQKEEGLKSQHENSQIMLTKCRRKSASIKNGTSSTEWTFWKSPGEKVMEDHGRDLRARKRNFDNDKGAANSESSTCSLTNNEANVKEHEANTHKFFQALKTWRKDNIEKINMFQSKSRELQRPLKALCAEVRNEYSKHYLQKDFRAGLEELTRGADGEDDDLRDMTTDVPPPIPEDFKMDVYCISANDYLKIQGIKPSTDGPPNTFSKASDTQIPALRKFVHAITAKHQQTFTESFVSSACDMLDRVKLVAEDANHVPCDQLSRECKDSFESEMISIQQKLKCVEVTFRQKIEDTVQSTLRHALEAGATKGNAAAMSTVKSWGSTSRRNRQERTPSKNGLYWSTYFATSRRDGIYASVSAGQVDLNQELCDPMEKEFSADWQHIMDSLIKKLLKECEVEVLNLCNAVDKTLSSSFAEAGLAHARSTRMANASSRSCKTAITDAFRTMKETASASQRNLNRSLHRNIQERMRKSYTATTSVPSGPGKFSLMKKAMRTQTKFIVPSMFSESVVELLEAIQNLIKELSSMIGGTPQIILRSMDSIYSVAWDSPTSSAASFDPESHCKVRACRDKLIPDLNRLIAIQKSAMEMIGMEREELEANVDNSEERINKEDASEDGRETEFSDSNDDASINSDNFTVRNKGKLK